MGQALSADAWLDQFIAAAGEVANTSLGGETSDVCKGQRLDGAVEGALLSIQHGTESVHLGLMSDVDGCAALTRALLQMEEEDEVADADITDAVGEIVNILAGVVQRGLDGQGDHVALGLPIYVRGQVFHPHRSETVSASLNLGPTRADLIVIRGELSKAS